MKEEKMPLRRFVFAALAAALAVSTLRTEPLHADTFDFQSGNAPVEVVIPAAIPVIYQFVSPGANDATLVLRITTVITNAWFDAIAPYHPTAVGVYSKLDRRPPHQRTDANRNTAILYASYHVLNSLLPQHTDQWRAMMTGVGLDPDDNSMQLSSPIGVGNRAGKAVVAAREHDGMNQLGDEGGQTYNRRPYADYTGYEPVNTAYQLTNPSRWQPDVVTTGNGLFKVQQFVTPQLRFTVPYSYDTPNQDQFQAPVPQNSNHENVIAYTQQANEVLAASANLTDYQKAAAELFDDKLRSLGFSALFLLQSHNLSLQQFVHLDFLLNVAAFDTSIAIWNQKFQHDAVRPFSAIRYLYGDSPVTAWGGPGKGTVNDLPASQWRSYLSTADHPEYPSASASFCAAHAQAARRFFGNSDVFGWSVPIPAGSSRVEPGLTPATDLVVGPWNTWTDFANECATSRFWAGVHFLASLPAGQAIGTPIGDLAYEFVAAHIAGIAD
jgi:hypothetical protein